MSNEMNLEDRLAELEVKFAFQQETIDSLNQTVTEQWGEIDKLKRQSTHLKSQLEAMEDGAGDIENTRPPHY